MDLNNPLVVALLIVIVIVFFLTIDVINDLR